MKNKNLSVKYAVMQMLYWSAYCGFISYAVTFLLAKGFKASQAGLILFCSNFLSFLLQPLVASKADKATKNILPNLIIIISVLSLSCFSIIWSVSLPATVLAILFFVGSAILDIEQPFMNALVVRYEENGWSTNYGVCRGLGSLGYGITSVMLGYVMEKSGVNIMLPISIGFTLLFALICATYPKIDGVSKKEKTNEACSLSTFIFKYKWYIASLFGLLLLCMAHVMLENFLIEIFINLRGGSSNIGIALFIATVTETVILFLINVIIRKAGTKKLLIIGGFSYILKVVLFIMAKSIWVIYLAQILQMTSYTFISPTQLYYAQECTEKADMIKGQSMSTAFWAMGCALGNLLGGVLITASGLKTMLFCALGFSVIGTVIFLITLPHSRISDKIIVKRN